MFIFVINLHFGQNKFGGVTNSCQTQVQLVFRKFPKTKCWSNQSSFRRNFSFQVIYFDGQFWKVFPSAGLAGSGSDPVRRCLAASVSRLPRRGVFHGECFTGSESSTTRDNELTMSVMKAPLLCLVTLLLSSLCLAQDNCQCEPT